MFSREVLIFLLLSQFGRSIFSDAVPPWSCTSYNSFLSSICPNPRVNPSPLLLENYGSVIGDGFGGVVRLFPSLTKEADSVAVKTYAERYVDESEENYLSVIKHEYSIAERLRHQNIIATYDLYTDGTDWHQIMEYCPFELQQVVKARKMPQSEIDCIFRGVVEGVAYMHSAGVAHLDLKLSNIMLSVDGTPKIIDFGSSVSFRAQRNSSIAVAEGVRGALPFLAPEILANRSYDPGLADIWALGIIYVCMTLRRCPWRQPSLWDQSFRLFLAADDSFVSDMHTGSVPELSSLDDFDVGGGPESLLQLLPQASQKIIGRMLDLRPESRATMVELRSDVWFQGILACPDGDCGKPCGCKPLDVEGKRAESKEKLDFGYALYWQHR